jgi:transcription-repair coupling factor (superfamily II helicase)
VELSAGADAPTIEAEADDSIHEPRVARLSIGETAAALAEAIARSDVLFVAADEQRAEAVAAALAAAAPDAAVIHCPSSDALPGDTTPASPANVGRRVAALRRLRQLIGSDEARPPIALISTAEAAARLYPAPVAFEAAPPTLAPGAALDVELHRGDYRARLYRRRSRRRARRDRGARPGDRHLSRRCRLAGPDRNRRRADRRTARL